MIDKSKIRAVTQRQRRLVFLAYGSSYIVMAGYLSVIPFMIGSYSFYFYIMM